MRSHRKIGRLAPFFAVLAFVAACNYKTCKDVGYEPGLEVTFYLAAIQEAHPNVGLHVTACAADLCSSQTYWRITQGEVISAGGESLDPTSAIPVSLTVLDDGNHVLFKGTTSVMAHKAQPNGDGCDPTIWRAEVYASVTSTLAPHK